MKQVTEILLSAAFVLTPEENWIIGYFAKRANGSFVMTLQDDDIVSFCLRGAIYAAGGMTHGRNARPPAVMEAESCVLRVINADDTGEWNNTHAHAEVLDALYRAAELAEQS